MSTIDLRPKLGLSLNHKRNRRLLFICFFDPAGIMTVYENIALWQKFSRYDIVILNLWPARGTNLVIPAGIDLHDYAGIIVHCTVAYHPDNLDSLDANLARPLEEYDGVKVLMKQDEHVLTARVAQFIGRKKFDLVLSCVPPAECSKAYPREIVGEPEFLHILTGYVSPFMRGLNYKVAARPLDITYRGSIQPLQFGRLGFEKRQIGWDVEHALAGHGLRLDISSRSQDRFSGEAWFDFLGRSRAVLGVESGSNLFDFTGEVEAWCDEFIKRHPDRDHASEEFYREADRLYLHQFEGNVDYAQLSPRHFEAAATRSVQILYEGTYSGIFIANRHFLPLRRDLKNLDEIVDFLRDDRRVSDMVECAFEEIIRNPTFHYESFVVSFDQAVDARLAEKHQTGPVVSVAAPARRGNRRVLLLAGHEPAVDPRVDWMAAGLTSDFDVCELYTHADALNRTAPAFERVSDRRVRVQVARHRHDWDAVPDIRQMPNRERAGISHLMLLYMLAELPPRLLQRTVGALDADQDDIDRFRWMVRHFLNTNSAFIQAGRLIGEFDAVIAADLNTLPAAIVLAEEYGAPLLYDAHEFWPYAFVEYRHWEIEFWSAFERGLAARADLRVTVSPQLARVMSLEYGCDFDTVPNCVSKASIEPVDLDAALARMNRRDEVRFIFLGGFARGRGIEDLITAWQHVRGPAQLLLQGPEGAFRDQMIQLTRSLGLLGNGVSFPDPVDPGALVSAARQADIGIVPYAPSSVNNRYCSPNKLSQYMAAGLPILCNETEFVRSVVVDNDIGVAVDFRKHQELARIIDELARSKDKIAAMSRRAYRLFETTFNWEQASAATYRKLAAAVAERPQRDRPDLDFSWIEQGREMRMLAEEFEGSRSIFLDTTRQNVVYPAEIIGLNNSYEKEIIRLNKELVHLNKMWPAEFVRLEDEIQRLNTVYPAEIAQLNAILSKRDTALVREITRLNRIIGNLTGKAANPERQRGKWLRTTVRRLAANQPARAAARAMITRLPDPVGRRIKTSLVVFGRL